MKSISQSHTVDPLKITLQSFYTYTMFNHHNTGNLLRQEMKLQFYDLSNNKLMGQSNVRFGFCSISAHTASPACRLMGRHFMLLWRSVL